MMLFEDVGLGVQERAFSKRTARTVAVLALESRTVPASVIIRFGVVAKMVCGEKDVANAEYFQQRKD